MAGSDLFTGNNMVMTNRRLEKKVSFMGTKLKFSGFLLLGNLIGSVLIAILYMLIVDLYCWSSSRVPELRLLLLKLQHLY